MKVSEKQMTSQTWQPGESERPNKIKRHTDLTGKS